MKIKFLPSDKDVELLVPPPKPASQYVPEWYVTAKTGRANPRFDTNGQLSSISFKACVPFSDALKGGFIQESWCDVRIESDGEGKCSFWYRVGPKIIEVRDMSAPASNIPINTHMYESQQFAWTCPWIPQTPKGWSILITSPMNRVDLPFRVMDGIIDSDRFFHAPMGFVPFYIEKDFKGTIPTGTPLFQMIPIKREAKWVGKVIKYNEKEARKNHIDSMRRFTGTYADRFWERKSYVIEEPQCPHTK